jgi:ribosome-associated protein
MNENRKEVLKKICDSIEEKKGEAIVIMDISKISSFADFFVLCNGNNQRQNQAICDGIKERLKKDGRLSPAHVEGYQEADWILMDYLDCVVHIFSPEARNYYKLERLWHDGVRLEQAALTT